MRFKIEEHRREEHRREECTLGLRYNDLGGGVDLVVLDSDGKVLWYLATLCRDGLKLWAGIEDSSGLPLDSSGQLKIKRQV